MMNKEERELALIQMQFASDAFYEMAKSIRNHPFIEFTGLMNEYIKCCRSAHEKDIDFSECSIHSGKKLPIRDFEADYINEKLGCIFTGRLTLESEKE